MKSICACIWIGVCLLSVIAKSVVADTLTDTQLDLPVEILLSAQDRALLLEMDDDVPVPLRQKLRDMPDDVDGVEMTIVNLHELLLGLMRQKTRIGEQVDSTGRVHAMSPVLAEQLEAIDDLSLRLHRLAEDMDSPLAGSALSYEIDEEFLRRLSRHGTDPGRVRLRIVDQEGHPVDGVGLTIERSYADYLRADLRSEYEDVDIDGEHVFNLRRGMHSVTIYAVKDGYYRAQRYLRAPRKADIEERIMRDVLLGRQTELEVGEPHLTEVEIVLQKKGDLVDLYQFGGDLSIRPDGSRVIGRLRVPDGHPVVRPVPERVFTERIENSVREKEWIANDAVSVQLEFDDDGRIADLVDYTYPGMAGAVLMPQRMVIRMHDPEGGFLLYEPEDNVGRGGWRSVARQMLQAPEDGYVQELILTPEQQYHGGYFYFRNQGRYGKGGWGPVRLPRDRQSMVLRVGFYLNPTPGDRNLETGE